MKKNLVILLSILLYGCLGEPTLDTGNKESVKKSLKEIAESLPTEEKQDFDSAITYFTFNGDDAPKSLLELAALTNANKDSFVLDNLETINGLTGKEIIKKHKVILAEAKKKSELNMQAEKQLEEKRFDDAIATYRQLSTLSGGTKAAQEGIEKSEKAKTLFTEKMEYLDKVAITKFTAKRIDTYSNNGIPAVRLSLKNTGKRSLDKVQVVVYFQNKDGDTFYEEDFYPVNVGNFINRSKPLKAGYVYEMEQDVYYTIKSQLSEWEEGKAVAKVTDIEFSEER